MVSETDGEEQAPTPAPDGLEERKLRLYDEKRNVTSRLSDTTRYLGFGLLAVYFALRADGGSFAEYVRNHYPNKLLLIGAVAVLGLTFDLLQYICGERAVKNAIAAPDKQYTKCSISYLGWTAFYKLKLLTTVVGCLLLIWLFFAADGAAPR